jgi:hypothetical protein
VALKQTRDTAYVELRAALKSGDPQRVQAASSVYSIAEREYQAGRKAN